MIYLCNKSIIIYIFYICFYYKIKIYEILIVFTIFCNFLSKKLTILSRKIDRGYDYYFFIR